MDLEHLKGAYWMRLTSGENGTRLVAPVGVGEAVPTSQNMSELSSVEDTIDVAREDAEANVPMAVSTSKEPGAVERALTHVPFRSWCLSCVASRGADDHHRKTHNFSAPLRVECDFMFLSSQVQLATPGLTIFNMMDRESQSMAAAVAVKAGCVETVRSQSDVAN